MEILLTSKENVQKEANSALMEYLDCKIKYDSENEDV